MRDRIEQGIINTIKTIENAGISSFNQRITVLYYNIYQKFGEVLDLHRSLFYYGNTEERVPDISNKEKREVFNRVRENHEGVFLTVFGMSMYFGKNFIYCSDGSFVCLHDEALELYKVFRSYIPKTDYIPKLQYISCSQRGINSIPLKINKIEEDLSCNYNDDVPTERITEIIHENKSSIIILHGIPGGGKTTYIRKLINDNKDLRFYWFDSRYLSAMTEESFIEFMGHNKNSVFILEDCENLLVNGRDSNILGNFLNISDGMLGDSFNIRFICTFNSELNDIDPAILRKGRLKLKYEFKKLIKEKVKALADKLGIDIPKIEPMPLCDIYNYAEENGTKQKQSKIGFS